MKKMLFAILMIAAIISLSLTTSAQNNLLSDGAALLTQNEAYVISDLLERLSAEAQADIAVITVDSYDGYNIEVFTEKLCDDGFTDNGIVLLISIDTREYCLTKCGNVEHAIDGAGLDFIEESFIPYLSDGNYYVAFSVFASLSAEAIKEYNSTGECFGGEGFKPDVEVSDDGTVTLTEGSRPVSHYVICIVVGLILALISMLIMQRGMKTVKSQNYAADYIVRGSLDIRVSSDRFLYKTVTKTPKPQSHSSSGKGFSGGRSSSGRF